jgi:hypothetical protein
MTYVYVRKCSDNEENASDTFMELRVLNPLNRKAVSGVLSLQGCNRPPLTPSVRTVGRTISCSVFKTSTVIRPCPVNTNMPAPNYYYFLIRIVGRVESKPGPLDMSATSGLLYPPRVIVMMENLVE